MLIVVLLIWGCAFGPIVSQNFKNGTFEAFRVCDDNSVKMYMWRNFGTGHWNSSIEISEWPELKEIKLELVLDAPAEALLLWKVKDYEVRAKNENRVFHIETTRPENNRNEVFMTVYFDPNSFPMVERLKLFGITVCDDPVQSPTLSGGLYRTSQLTEMKIMQCGRRVIEQQKLITNGFAAKEGDWPWHSAIYHSDVDGLAQSYKCGGTLITSTAVLTAAHCLYDITHPIVPERVVVHVGKLNLALAGLNTQQFGVRRLFIHDDYKPNSFLDDIGLIRLATEATFTAYVKPICLWDANRLDLNEVVNKNGIVVGWGLNERHQIAKSLGQANMPVVPVIQCLKSDPSFFGSLLTEKTYCAGFRNGTGVCNGDSGGGMYFDDNGIYRLRGIVSITKSQNGVENFCDSNSYVVFTDVAQYWNWIQERTR